MDSGRNLTDEQKRILSAYTRLNGKGGEVALKFLSILETKFPANGIEIKGAEVIQVDFSQVETRQRDEL